MAALPGSQGQQGAVGSSRRTSAASALCGLLAALFPCTPGGAQELPEVADDLVGLADLPEEERARRRKAPTEEVEDEDWFRQGFRTYRKSCAACHPTKRGVKRDFNMLTGEKLEKTGYTDPEKIASVIRYGRRKMPGFAADCADVSDNGICNVAVPLTEEKLRDVGDFLQNRVTNDWAELNERKLLTFKKKATPE